MVDDLDDGRGNTKRYKSLSHGPAPTVLAVDGLESAAQKATVFVNQCRGTRQDGSSPSICVIASSAKNREAMSRQLQAAGLPCVTISAQSNHSESHDVVHFATMHRAKGLEFDFVAVVAPLSYFGDPEETQNQRKLLYVALTRAKLGAVILSYRDNRGPIAIRGATTRTSAVAGCSGVPANGLVRSSTPNRPVIGQVESGLRFAKLVSAEVSRLKGGSFAGSSCSYRALHPARVTQP